MADYYVNKKAQPTGEHEIHTSTCPYLPDSSNRQYLGSLLMDVFIVPKNAIQDRYFKHL